MSAPPGYALGAVAFARTAHYYRLPTGTGPNEVCYSLCGTVGDYKAFWEEAPEGLRICKMCLHKAAMIEKTKEGKK
jgi:hypothetical protein